MRCCSISTWLIIIFHFVGLSTSGMSSCIRWPTILGFINWQCMLKHLQLYSAMRKCRISFCFAQSLICCAASMSFWKYALRHCMAWHFISSGLSAHAKGCWRWSQWLLAVFSSVPLLFWVPWRSLCVFAPGSSWQQSKSNERGKLDVVLGTMTSSGSALASGWLLLGSSLAIYQYFLVAHGQSGSVCILLRTVVLVCRVWV